MKRLIFGMMVGAVSAVAIGPLSSAFADSGTESQRLAGSNRYETAVAISRLQWPDDGAFSVFLASGESTADALALGASTQSQGPILLVRRDELPPVVADEISRLKPCRVIVAGGASVVSDAVFNAARGMTTPAKCSQNPG